MNKVLIFVREMISGIVPFALLMICGTYFSLKHRFVQLRLFFSSFKNAFNNNKSLKSCCTSLSSTIGTGNILGVAAALSLGGAGAVFWMWVTSFFSMIIKMIEIMLSVKYKGKFKNKEFGGPMVYINKISKNKLFILSITYTIFGIISSFTSGNIVQMNFMLSTFSSKYFFIFSLITSIILLYILKGGNKRIENITSILVPIMAFIYIVITVSVIFYNKSKILSSFKMIFIGAFCPSAVSGGVIFSFLTTLSVGTSRGIFSNEAGLGTSGIAHFKANDFLSESLYGIFEVFVDTILICTLTALTILTSGVKIDYENIDAFGLIINSISGVFGDKSYYIISFMIFLFGFSSIVGWGLYGLSFSEFLLKDIGKYLFIVLFSLSVLISPIIKLETSLQISGLSNGIMLALNVFFIFLERKKVSIELKKLRGKYYG